MDKKNVETNYKWTIEQGDYKLNRESTRTFSKKFEQKKLIKKILWSLLYLIIVVVIAIWYFSN